MTIILAMMFGATVGAAAMAGFNIHSYNKGCAFGTEIGYKEGYKEGLEEGKTAKVIEFLDLGEPKL